MSSSVAEAPRKPRLAILVNTVAPYRLPIYAALAKEFETVILHGGHEPNRRWKIKSGSSFQSRKVWTLQVPSQRETGTNGVCDTCYVHLNFGLLWELPRFRPEVLISNELGVRTIIALMYASIFRIPLWVWWGGTLHSERNICGRRRLLRRYLPKAIHRWISYGATSTEYLEHLRVPRERILQIQNCVEQERFQAEPATLGDWFPDSPGPLLLSTGQLIERKGMDKLIRACGRLAAKGRTFTLVLVGSGCEYERLQALAEEQKLQHFHILPEKPQAVLNQLYRRADAFIFPTLEDVWGLVVNEALWAGCPVLCSTYAGCAPEIVPPENVFDPMSADSFEAALEKIFNGSLASAEASVGAMRTHQQVSAALLRSLQTNTPGQLDHETSTSIPGQERPLCSL